MKPAKIAVDVGKTAVNVGTTVATTAMKPAVYAVNVGTSVTSAVVDTGKKAVRDINDLFCVKYLSKLFCF